MHLADGNDVVDRIGLFFNGKQQALANLQAYDAAARKQLRGLSLKLTGLSAGL